MLYFRYSSVFLFALTVKAVFSAPFPNYSGLATAVLLELAVVASKVSVEIEKFALESRSIPVGRSTYSID